MIDCFSFFFSTQVRAPECADEAIKALFWGGLLLRLFFFSTQVPIRAPECADEADMDLGVCVCVCVCVCACA